MEVVHVDSHRILVKGVGRGPTRGQQEDGSEPRRRLRVLRSDGDLEALRMLCDRREELMRLRVQTVNRLQRLLAELVPGQAKKDLTALQAKAILATVRPRDIAGRTQRRIAAECPPTWSPSKRR
jgi:hypothetical protein